MDYTAFIKKAFDTSKKKKLFLLILFLIVFLFLLDLLFPLPDLKPYSKAIYASDGTLLTAYLTEDHKWRLRTNIEDVSPDLIKAIITKEDKNFFFHRGVDFFAIIRSGIKNLTQGKVVTGASTITMQVVRILEPKKRTIINKMLEALRSIQFEVHYSKKEILSIYLSHLPLGGNIEGVKSASFFYFNHPPNTLSLSQAILISIIPANPNKLRLDRINNGVGAQRDYWIKRFMKLNIFSQTDLKDALNEPIVQKRYNMRNYAPHFSNYVKNYNKEEDDEVFSTLNLNVQKITENILFNYINRIRDKNISNGAVIVVDNMKSEVVAYCGSAAFFDKQNQGEVNGILAVRSPGSTLKPALYAEAIEQGFLTTGTKMLDVPMEFGGYEPENFNQKFNGMVTAQYALVNSLNIPAVNLLNEIGVNKFIELLNSLEFKKLNSQKNKLGLSMILGGCGVTLEELTNLYSTFGRKGIFKTLKYTKTQNDDETKRIFSEETNYLIADILSGLSRNDINAGIDFSKLPKFAWKTGTSYGKRDAWSAGFNPNYTIVVWVGNFNNDGSPFLIGADAALPLLAELFNAIDYNSGIKWFDKPEKVITRKVCSESGLLPLQFCKEQINDIAIEDRSHNSYCDIHQEVFVNEEESIQYCFECLPTSNYKKKIYTVYKVEYQDFIKKQFINYDKVPFHNPECARLKYDGELKIISPSENFEYFIDRNDPQEITLQAVADYKAKQVYWYVDDKLIRRASSSEKVFHRFDEGKHTIVCMDDQGRSVKIVINVKKY
ncbi:MAG: penicillin-binding protein 1C [Ignavibacterium sp.]|jgi:penicillin-binding protein 1C|nr:penicillin-binding protein 1C [Ignavibacterium sp.]